MITSCLECRRRKLKCNKGDPCTNCTKFGRECVFLAPALDQASQLKLTEIKEKVGSCEFDFFLVLRAEFFFGLGVVVVVRRGEEWGDDREWGDGIGK